MATVVSSIMMIAGALALVLAVLGAIHPRLTIRFWKVRSRKSAFLFYLAACLVLTIAGSQIYSTTPEAEKDRQARAEAEARSIEAENTRQEALREAEEERCGQISALETQVAAMASSDLTAQMAAYQRLLELDPENSGYQAKVSELRTAAASAARTESPTATMKESADTPTCSAQLICPRFRLAIV